MTRWLRAALLLLCVCLAAPAAAAVDEKDLLPIDQAFVLSAHAVAADRIELRWRIADGYYLYRHRMAASALDGGASVSALELPQGKRHRDAFFGDVETYRASVTGVLRDVVSPQTPLRLQVKYQGCADVGICYPPQTRTLTVAMPVAATAQADAQGDLAGLRRSLRGGGGAAAPLPGQPFGNAQPLPEAQAFAVDAIADGGDALLVRLTPAAGYYLYRDQIAWSLSGDSGIQAPALPRAAWPQGTPFHDAHFGNVIVYFDQVELRLPLRRTHPRAAQVRLRVDFQGCQNDGVCYPPIQRSFAIALPAAGARANAAAKVATSQAAGAANPMTVAQPASAAALPANATPVSTPAQAIDAPLPTPPSGPPIDQGNDVAATTATAASAAAAVRLDPLRIGWVGAVLLALLGGVILNLMPCVLPVLSLKALSLANSGDHPQHARRHALWYTAGVVASMLALGALALALRTAGLALGWGFQLQQPLVVAVLGLVLFALGLNLSGLWHVGGGWTGLGDGLTRRGGASGDFFTGVLAVVVATPCTAPFMGSALAFAFASPPWQGLGVFVALGLGLALPFLLIGFIPALAKRLPRPGAWMETLKQILAFPLYLTAIWLAWVLAKQRGADAIALWLLAATAVAFAAWAWSRHRLRHARWALGLMVLAVLTALTLLGSIHRLPPPATRAAAPRHGDLAPVPFSEERLRTLRAAGRPVFLNMTADWCVTCKANERAVFAQADFRNALGNANAVYMVGDYTDVDPAITAFLQRHGAVGVPLYLVYPRNGDAPQALPALLTPALARDALAQAAR